jgi:8-oxo-dGTP pyrophosphatase MutT (NUDIX family)
METLGSFDAQSDVEQHDLDRILAVIAAGDPWSRAQPLHLTGSALVAHPATGRVLLRWHERQQAWLQVGGHGDPGETDARVVALREAQEETGLHDVTVWPATPGPIHVVCVPVAAKGDEPAHEHADIRYLLTTETPDAIVPENDGAPLRWLTFDDALEFVTEDNLRETIRRARCALTGDEGS